MSMIRVWTMLPRVLLEERRTAAWVASVAIGSLTNLQETTGLPFGTIKLITHSKREARPKRAPQTHLTASVRGSEEQFTTNLAIANRLPEVTEEKLSMCALN